MTAAVVPHSRRKYTASASDSAHFTGGFEGIGNKSHNEQAQTTIESRIRIMHTLRVAQLKGETRIGLARTSDFQKSFGRVDTDDLRGLGHARQGQNQGSRAATDIEHA